MRMPALAQQARWIGPARRWLAATAVLAALGILAGQVLPRFARLTDLAGKNRSALRQLADAQADIASLRSVQLSAQLSAPAGRATSNPDSWIQRLTDLSQSCRLQGITVQAGVPQQNGQICRLPLVLNFDGDYLDAFSFLKKSERLPAVVRISTLHVRCTNLPAGQVEVQVAMNAYVPEDP